MFHRRHDESFGSFRMNDAEVKRSIIDRDNLPPMFPTHRHSSQFWEQLGRAIASFGFLEDTLRRAYFAFTGTRPVAPEDAERAVKEWGAQLERIMTEQLWNLAEKFGEAASSNPNNSTENIEELVSAIKEAAVLRNVLCHGSWMVPDQDGKSLPRFTRRDRKSKELVVFEGKVDVEYLLQLQAHVTDLICSVIDTVTHMGYKFPGGAGPGKPIM